MIPISVLYDARERKSVHLLAETEADGKASLKTMDHEVYATNIPLFPK